MNAKDLIGKTCLREKPAFKYEYVCDYGYYIGSGGMRNVPDYTYCTRPVKILTATDHHIIVEAKNTIKFNKNEPDTTEIILDERYCDDNWIDYDMLISSVANK